jgi:hypothetical protein
MAGHQEYLTDDEINRFIDDLDADNDGNIAYKELEQKLNEVGKQLAPKPKRHHIYHDKEEQGKGEFLRTLIGTNENSIPRAKFAECVRSWEIPSLEQDRKEAQDEDEYVKNMSIWRKLRAYWAVEGPQIAFMALVVSFMLAFGIWQLVSSLLVASLKNKPIEMIGQVYHIRAVPAGVWMGCCSLQDMRWCSISYVLLFDTIHVTMGLDTPSTELHRIALRQLGSLAIISHQDVHRRVGIRYYPCHWSLDGIVRLWKQAWPTAECSSCPGSGRCPTILHRLCTISTRLDRSHRVGMLLSFGNSQHASSAEMELRGVSAGTFAHVSHHWADVRAWNSRSLAVAHVWLLACIPDLAGDI